MRSRPTGALNIARFQGILLEQRTALLKQVDEIALAGRDFPEFGEGTRETQDAGDSSVYEVAESERLSAAQRSTERIRRIDAALARIAQGSYGICQECEEPLDERRLLSIPEAGLCAECQELEMQKRDAGPPPKL